LAQTTRQCGCVPKTAEMGDSIVNCLFIVAIYQSDISLKSLRGLELPPKTVLYLATYLYVAVYSTLVVTSLVASTNLYSTLSRVSIEIGDRSRVLKDCTAELYQLGNLGCGQMQHNYNTRKNACMVVARVRNA